MLNRMKKVLAVTLAATTILGTSLTAFAATAAGSAAGSAVATTKTSSGSGSSSSGSTETTPTEGSSVVAGVKSTVAGINYATVVSGSAVTTPANAISAAFGLAANEKPFAKFYNFDAKKSTAAKAVIDAVVAFIPGAVLGPVVNVELGKMTSGKYSLLPETGAVALAFGVPAGFAKGAGNMAIIKVTTTGVAILPDLDTNANTITVATTGGAGVYAIIKY